MSLLSRPAAPGHCAATLQLGCAAVPAYASYTLPAPFAHREGVLHTTQKHGQPSTGGVSSRLHSAGTSDDVSFTADTPFPN